MQTGPCVDIRRRSTRSYFKNKFTDENPSRVTFWKSFFTNKGHRTGNDLILGENGNIVHDSKQVANVVRRISPSTTFRVRTQHVSET